MTSTSGPYDSVETEYWYNVSKQEDLPIAGDVDFDFDAEKIASLVKQLAAINGDERLIETFAAAICSCPEVFGDARKLLGITDKRAYLELSYIASRTPHPSDSSGLWGCQSWNMARHPLSFFYGLLAKRQAKGVQMATSRIMAEYLIDSGFKAACKGFSNISAEGLKCVVDSLIVPREAQQRLAKRRGHGCEGELARVIVAVGASLLPEGKATNPMGARDPNLDITTLKPAKKKKGYTYPFDMLVMEGDMVRVALQSLIHTSDPGQYGVNKSDETVTIADRFAEANKVRPKAIELWGLLDGVGFS